MIDIIFGTKPKTNAIKIKVVIKNKANKTGF